MKKVFWIMSAAVLAAAIAGCGRSFGNTYGTFSSPSGISQPEYGSAGDTEADIKASVEATDQAVHSFMNSSELSGMETDAQIDAAITYLYGLSDGNVSSGDAYVEEDSIVYHENMQLISYEEADGSLCYIDFREQEGETNEVGYASGDGAGYLQDTDPANVLLLSALRESQADSLNYYSSADAWFQSCDTIQGSVTVASLDQFRYGLSGMDMVIIECHGNLYELNGQIVPFFRAFGEVENEVRDSVLEEDTRNARVVKITEKVASGSGAENYEFHNHYCITPYFFSYYYGGNGLEDAIVHLGSCHGFGNSEWGYPVGDNYGLSNAFLECGAAAVIGHDNSVYTYYDYQILMAELEYLEQGYTIGEALAYAESLYYDNDRDYMIAYGNAASAANAQYHLPSHNEIRGNAQAVLNPGSGAAAPDWPEMPEDGEEMWIRAYQSILESQSSGTFSLVNIDDNGIPELILASDNSHSNSVSVYTCDENGYAYYLGEFGTFGEIYVMSGSGYILTNETYGGVSSTTLYSLEGQMCYVAETLFDNEYGAPAESVVFEINGEQVTAETYHSEYNTIFGFPWVTAGYTEGYDITSENIAGLAYLPRI